MNKDIEKVNENAQIKEEENVARNRGEKIVVEYRKPSIFMSLLLILIGVCLATIVLTLLYIFKIKPGLEAPQEAQEHEEIVIDNNEEEKEEEIKVPDVDLSIEGEFVKELKNKIPIGYYITETYTISRVTQDHIPVLDKTEYAVERLRKDKKGETVTFSDVKDELTSGRYIDSSGNEIATVTKFTIEQVEDEYRKVFGVGEIAKENIETNMGYVYEYSSKNNCFYGHSYAGGGGGGIIWGTKTTKVEKSDDGKEIYVYQYYLRRQEFESNYGNIFVTSARTSNPIGEETTDAFYYYDNTSDIYYVVRDEMFDKYKDKLVEYKSTFKLDTNENYYWVSTEPVK